MDIATVGKMVVMFFITSLIRSSSVMFSYRKMYWYGSGVIRLRTPLMGSEGLYLVEKKLTGLTVTLV